MKKNNIVNLHTANKAPACPIYKIKSLFNKATHPALEAAKKHIHQVLESGKCPYI